MFILRLRGKRTKVRYHTTAMTSNASDENGEIAKVSQENIDLAEEKRQKGNEMFKNNKFVEAISLFSQAIDLNPQDETFYSNRSLCHLKMENYGDSLIDAEKSIQVKPSFVKGYFRKATALMAMGKFKQAAEVYHAVMKKRPKNEDVKKKYEMCQKMFRMQSFERAIAFQETSAFDDLDLSSLTLSESYDGPCIPDDGKLTVEFVEHLKTHQKDQKLLHHKFVIQILMMAKKVLQEHPTCVHCTFTPDIKFTVCGDVHGQYYDLLNIFTINGDPSETNQYLFNGDFVDRGSFSVEVILLLLSYKVLYPRHFFLNRGNHETVSMNQMYGFEGEVKHKYSPKIFNMFTEVFNHLPLAHVLNDKVFVVHGGLPSTDGVKIDDINQINRIKQPPSEGLMCDLLWADPQPNNGRAPSHRGVSICFGPDVTEEFCKTNGLDYVIRSHEMVDQGYEEQHNAKCITIFSAPNYTDQRGNLAAFINFAPDMKPKYTQFPHVPHPEIKPMAYNEGMGSMFGIA